MQYTLQFEKEEYIVSDLQEELLAEIDKQLQSAGILMHMTTLERVVDATLDVLMRNSTEVQ